MAFDSVGASGRYELAVPVQYGQNPFNLVAYGPRGERRQSAYVFRALQSMLPAGTFEYAGGSGACVSTNNQKCAWSSNADFRYGITSRLSARAGATEYFWHNESASLHPYVGIAVVPARGIGIELEALHAAYRRMSLRLDPIPAISIAGDYLMYMPTKAGAALSGGTGRNDMSLYVSIAPGVGRPGFEIQGWRTVDQFGVSGSGRVASSIGVRGATLRPYGRVVRSLQGMQSFFGMDAMLMPASWGVFTRAPVWMRTTLETTARGAWSRSELMVSHSATRRTNLEGGVRWQRGMPHPQFTVSLVMDLAAMRSRTSVLHGSAEGETQVAQSLSGSIRWDGRMRNFIRSADAVLNRAGVAGTVYLDANGNSRFDRGERPLSGVTVRVENATATTNNAGHYEVWGMLPTSVVAVTVDTGTFESPWWTPTYNQLTARAVPNRAVPVDIPVVEGGIVEGRVETKDGVGVVTSVILTHLATGRRYTVETFTDGGFYQMGLPPGEYMARAVDPAGSAGSKDVPQIRFSVTRGATTRELRVVIR